jgi:hypothetical protein
VKDIGVGLALGILMDTFLVRTLLVPSTVVLLGRWNWWPRHIEAGMGYPGTEKHSRLHLPTRHADGGGGGEKAGDASSDVVPEVVPDVVPDIVPAEPD